MDYYCGNNRAGDNGYLGKNKAKRKGKRNLDRVSVDYSENKRRRDDSKRVAEAAKHTEGNNSHAEFFDYCGQNRNSKYPKNNASDRIGKL